MNRRLEKHRIFDNVFKYITIFCALLILVIVLAISIELFLNSLPAIKEFGFSFLWSTDWNPVKEKFGAASSIYGTLVATFIAIIIAVPFSLVIALFLTEIAHPSIATPVGYAIELLAAIPSIIYGMWGVFILAPFMAEHIIPPLQSLFFFLPIFQGKVIGGQGIFTAGVVLAVMILPYLTSIMRDVFNMVSPQLKESAYGVGTTTWEVTRDILIPQGISGIIGGVFLSLGRAIGETMAVTFIIGNSHRFSFEIFREGNTISSTLANEFAEGADNPLFFGVLMELGLILFAITVIMQLLSHFWLKRYGVKT
ncbi:MAG: phosphate ABC transporter permease subunit PstC [Myxococcota bacterium]